MNKYYMDANSTEKELIRLYVNENDIFRTEENRQKFKDWLTQGDSRCSPLMHVLTKLMNLSETDKFNKLRFNGEHAEAIKAARQDFIEYHRQCLDQLIVGIMANRRPSPKNLPQNKELIKTTINTLLAELETARYAKFVIADHDKHFIARAYAIQYGNATRGSKRPYTPVDQYIKNVGIEKYFNAPGTPEVLKFNLFSNKYSGKFRWDEITAFEEFYNETRAALWNSLTILNTRSVEELQFTPAELAGYPKIIPVECKLLIESGIKSVSGNSPLTDEDYTQLLQGEHRAIAVPPESAGDFPHAGMILIKDRGVAQILSEKETGAGRER